MQHRCAHNKKLVITVTGMPRTARQRHHQRWLVGWSSVRFHEIWKILRVQVAMMVPFRFYSLCNWGRSPSKSLIIIIISALSSRAHQSLSDSLGVLSVTVTSVWTRVWRLDLLTKEIPRNYWRMEMAGKQAPTSRFSIEFGLEKLALAFPEYAEGCAADTGSSDFCMPRALPKIDDPFRCDKTRTHSPAQPQPQIALIEFFLVLPK
jgi:hypothetical protein